MKFEALVLIFFELALGRLYAIKERRLDMNNVRKLEPVIQYLEVPEVPPEYEDDDKPSKYLKINCIIWRQILKRNKKYKCRQTKVRL